MRGPPFGGALRPPISRSLPLSVFCQRTLFFDSFQRFFRAFQAIKKAAETAIRWLQYDPLLLWKAPELHSKSTRGTLFCQGGIKHLFYRYFKNIRSIFLWIF